ncbi:MAG: flagellar hook-basal body complex protein FliE [bacterium]
MTISAIGQTLPALAPQATAPSAAVSKVDAEAFTKVLEEGLAKANETMQAADTTVDAMVRGQGANIHEAMIALDKADIAARLTTKIGQKLVQAYREVSQMQV